MSIKKNKLISIIKLSKQVYGRYKLQIIALIMFGFLGGLLEGIGVNALIPLFSFVGGENKGNDIISQSIEKFFVYLNIDFSLKYLLVFICLLFALKAIVLILCGYIKIKITADYEEKTRSNLFNKTLKANWSYLLTQKLGYLETVLMTDVRYGAALLEQISAIIMLLTSLLIYTLIAINISFHITLITLGLGGFLFLLLKPLIYKTKVTAHETEKANKWVAHYINENIMGIKTIKAISVSNQIVERAKEYFNRLKRFTVRIFLLRNVTGSLMQPISLIFICIVFAFYYKTPGFQIAAFVVIMYLIQKIFQYIKELQTNLHAVSEAVPYLKNVLNYEEQAIKNKEEDKGSSHFKFNNSLEFKNLSFSYNTEKEILSNINFTLKKGEMMGLIGTSGAGKTTIVDLILRLFNPNNGKILLDGKDVSKINIKEWRKHIGYVSQDIFLMNNTIANNIKFYDDSISDKDIITAAKMADIYDFIQGSPNKFETMVGEIGILLSAGQRQRIVIARILARNPEFLILDEATSSLDNESEVRIQKVVENLKGRITVLVIAHRLSTITNCDKLLILEKGKIVEEGQPDKLLKDKKSYFYKVYNIRK